ncbi:MAG TPA: energy transducer TonB, partial [Bryobacterales bacterium]|nr:energy transducer TonB [Bryobacterales bacterium]
TVSLRRQQAGKGNATGRQWVTRRRKVAVDLPMPLGMRARLLSLAIHAGVVALLIAISADRAGKSRFRTGTVDDAHFVRLVLPWTHDGGGGGGERSLLPASRGPLPRLARQQFTPPSATPAAVNPVLPMEPTLIAPPDVHVPEVISARLGDPFGRDGPASSGPGSGGGIGEGDQGGVGKRRGPGFGEKDGGGISATGTAGGVTAPTLLYKVEPEFSEEARKAKYQGTVILVIEVGEDGKPRSFRIVRGLGLGLDEKAIEAVTRWRFRPAMRNGRPVRVPATIEVNFRLL